MKIIFLCGSLKPGQDGVGDYTRRLAGEMKKGGFSVLLIALRDRWVNELISEFQESADGVSVPVLRFPAKMNSETRIAKIKKNICLHNPDWISLQYVPFSFDMKGIHFGLLRELIYLGDGYKWHIMFHELWIGRERSSYKFFLWSHIQQRQVRRLVRFLNPSLIHTHLPLYQYKLKAMKIEARPLPLFSNIKKQKFGFKKKDITSFKFVFFSQVDSAQPIINFINTLCNIVIKKGFVPQLILLGGDKIKMVKEGKVFKDSCPELKEVYITGFLNEFETSNVLSECDLAVTPVPVHALGKSGSVAAFLSHALPVAAPLINFAFSDEEIVFFNNGMNAVMLKPVWKDFEKAKEQALLIQSEIDIVKISKQFISDLSFNKNIE